MVRVANLHSMKELMDGLGAVPVDGVNGEAKEGRCGCQE